MQKGFYLGFNYFVFVDVNIFDKLIAPESVQRMWSLKRPPITTVSKL